MSVSLTSVKCPDCGASLSVEEGRTQFFCSYCGAKVILTNENEYIYRHVDEAGVAQAETDRMIKLRRLQMEEKEAKNRKKWIVVWLVGSTVLMALGVLGFTIGNDGLIICMILALMTGMAGALYFLIIPPRRSRVTAGDEAAISAEMKNLEDRDYRSAVALFQIAGFQNVSAVPLRDLNLFTRGKNGKVEAVSIDGSTDFAEGDVFPRTAKVIITYHSG